MHRYREYVGPAICDEMAIRLPMPGIPELGYSAKDVASCVRILPNGTKCLIGIEHVYAMDSVKPDPVAIDLGGENPFILWK